MEASSRRIDSSRVVGQALQTYREYARPILWGAVTIIGSAALIVGLLNTTDSILLQFLGTIVALAAQFLFTGYVVKLVQDVRDGRLDSEIGELFSAAAPYVPTLVLNGLLAGIAIFFGFLALIVPGLILLTIWAVISPAIVVENKGAMEAFGRSRELVKGEGWSVFGAIVIAFLILIVFSIIASVIGAAIGDDAGAVIVGLIAQVLAAPVPALVASILFFDLGGGSEVAPAPAEPIG